MTLLEVLQKNDAARTQQANHRDPTKLPNLGGAMKTFMEAWPNQPTGTDFLRASGLYYTCPREFVLNYFSPVANKWFDARSQFMMSCGSHLHEVIQEMVLGPMGVLKGRWVSVPIAASGAKIHTKEGYHPDPERAIWEWTMQQPLTWKYEEITVWDERLRISGHVDGLVSVDRIEWLSQNLPLMKLDPKKAYMELCKIPPGTEAKLEIKTTGSWVYQSIKMPNDISDAYKMQSNVYQKLLGVDRVIFWYVNRDTMDSKMLPYWFEKHWWDTAASKARVIWEAIRDLKLPDAFAACKTPQDGRAVKCVFKELCFHRWQPGQFEQWAKDQMAKQPDRKWLDLSGWTAT